MATIGTVRRRALVTPSFAHVLIALVVLTAVRLVGLHHSAVDLFYDEAQYWAWSRELAFGYFSKPPLLAWIIAAFDPVCGSTESCVRAASPMFHLGTCLIIYAIAADLYGRGIAAWSALAFALGTGLSFSSRIISTDVPLMFCWAVALLAFVRLMRGPNWRWAVALGAALGFGMLAKYAMVYFLLGAILAAATVPGARAVLARGQTWIALALAALILSPNVLWNAAHDFATMRHTGDNITGGGLRFRPLDALAFVGSQFAVAGPLVFAAFLVILYRSARTGLDRADRLMLAFAIPPLALVTALSFFRTANANWAAPSVLSMTILAVAWWLRTDRVWSLLATLAIGVAVQIALLIGDANAYRITVPALGKQADLYRRTLGWRALGGQAAQLAHSAGAATVAAEGRGEIAALIYYLRKEPFAALNWPVSPVPQHHFELTRALDAKAAEPIVLISFCPHPDRLRRYYAEVTPLAPIVTHAGPTVVRQYHTFKLARRIAPIGPLGPCAPTPAT